MTQNSNMNSKLPRFPEPLWRETDLPSFPKLKQDLDVDVAIVGGGISGLTTAYLLTMEGVKVAVIEAGQILNGTTGHTTAKITAQHGLIYDEFIQNFGEETARLYYEANNRAIDFIRNTVADKSIDCDLSKEDAYIFTNASNKMDSLINEFKAYEKLGINSDYLSEIPIPVKSQAAIVMRDQAQFHPLKYLKSLVQSITDNGGAIYEHTTAVNIEEGTNPKVITRDGHKVTSRHLVVASHWPFYDMEGFFFARMYPKRSYLIAVKTDKEYPGGMYINAEKPTRSLRYATYNGEKVVLFGGENHKTGVDDDTMENYESLAQFASETFGVQNILYRWSAQDPKTMDKIPYVGPMSDDHPNIYVMTAYRKWGMTNGTNAALLIRDYILERETPYKDVFKPQRFHANPDIKKFISINQDVAKHFIKGKLEHPNRQPEDLNKNEGAVVTVNGKRAGAYKDDTGEVFVVDTTCTHMGCELHWNNGETTWDCPCHGSRFSYKGEVIEGPAETPLKRVNEK
ncbi:FAD-dependent oxidoreductase [Mesobacillus harenae]|uniref:FAD-dependent oxidoreductase n=1 Tax=Mesobacillus harenae TaxID=2213203 RepID=UPI0015809CF6|nr:FAD-dependent oxidoreductase [Mesobacillus harenae]